MGDQMKRKLRYGVLAAAAVMAGSAAVSTGVQAGGNHHPAAAEGATIEVVTHGQASDPFWSVFKKGVDDAAAQMGATVNYSAPATFDMTEMASLIDAAVAKAPDGLVVSVPDYPALEASLTAAREAGIPIITANSGSEHLEEIGAITHVGQDDGLAGRAAGARLVEEIGATHVLCVHHEQGNLALDARCAGAQEAIEEAGGTLDIVQVDLNDAAGITSTVSSTLQADDSYDAILALGPSAATPAMAALDELGSDVPIATFDLSEDAIQAIIDGRMLFAIDQQQYLQGYLPIVMLTLYKNNANTVGGGQPVYTGPGFVDASNAETVLELTAAGSR
jgi:simple sugar transport system substrate-binding protein